MMIDRGRGRGGLARAGAMAWALLGLAGVLLLACWAVGRLMPVVLPSASPCSPSARRSR
jgi:hypothetical protein